MMIGLYMNKCLLILVIVLSCDMAFSQEIDWSKAEKIQSGVELISIEKSEPRLQKINIIRIDLKTKGLKFTGSDADVDFGKPMPDYPDGTIITKRIRTRDFMLNLRKKTADGSSGLNVIVAANSAPWSPWVKPYAHVYANPLGLAILNGKVLCDSRPHHALFVVYENGKVDIVSEVSEKDYSKIRVAASGFAILIKDGKLQKGDVYETYIMPRMAYGLSQNRRYMYIIAIDGRQKEWSIGATGAETAQLLKDAGAYDAINMDGGGSASLLYWDEKNAKVVAVSRQTASGYLRPVGSNIAIYLD